MISDMIVMGIKKLKRTMEKEAGGGSETAWGIRGEGAKVCNVMIKTAGRRSV